MPVAVSAAESGTCGDNLTWTLDDEGTLTISGTGDMKNWPQYSNDTPWFNNKLDIKKLVIQSGVTSIGKSAFNNCCNLADVDIPNSVTSIGEVAFYNCSNLKSITIPESVAYIGGRAFSFCGKLTDIIVRSDNKYYSSLDGVLYNKNKTELIHCTARSSFKIPDSVVYIDEEAFYDCSYLKTISIPNGVTSIGEKAFCGCRALTSISIPNSVTFIGKEAFLGCGIKSVIIPSGVTAIKESTFYGCDSLTNVNILNGVKYIEEEAFSRCSGLISVHIPDSVTSIKESAFLFCESLKSIRIPDSVTSIDSSVFRGCRSLTSVNISNRVLRIESYTFYDCDNLMSISIPDSVFYISSVAFYGCNSLKDVYYSGSAEQWKKINFNWGNECLTNADIHYNDETSDDDAPPADIEMPADINHVTVNYKGSAYGYFKVTDSSGNKLRNKRVSYTVDGGKVNIGTTDMYGFLCIQIDGITKSRDYTVSISGSGVQPSKGILSVTVEPLKFTSTYEAAITSGASVGLGIGVSGSIGKLEGEAKLADISLSGSNKKGLTFSQEYSSGKNKLTVTAKQNSDAALKAKAGLWAGSKAEKFGAEITAGDVHGIAK